MAKQRKSARAFDPLGGAPPELVTRSRAKKAPAPKAAASTRSSMPKAGTREGGDWLRVLEAVQTNIMVADPQLNLLFANQRALDTFRTFESEIQSHYGVSVDEMLGGSIHRFHKDPALIERVLHDPQELPRSATFEFGPVTLETRINRVVGADGDLYGYVVAWEDVSERTRLTKALDEERERKRDEELHAKVDSMLDVVTAAKDGDLTQEITVVGDDAIGQMGEGLQEFLHSLREHTRIINRNAGALTQAAKTLTEVSQQMGATAEQTSAQASVVATNGRTVSESLQTIATAVEEMTASIGEISTNALKASEMAREAVEVTESTNAIISKLGRSTQEIGDVIKLITSIAEQTNLLALNATIEAARAGDAGRGFAVVANEVKDLAKETAEATEEISGKIEAIQTDTEGAIDAIGSIRGMIRRINDMQAVIATAVEEQSATSSEMSINITRAADGSVNISSNLDGVAEAAQNTAVGANETQQVAGKLAGMARELHTLVSRFKWETKAAAGSSAASLEQIVAMLQKGGGEAPREDVAQTLARLTELLAREQGTDA